MNINTNFNVAEAVEKLNDQRLPFLTMLGAKVLDLDPKQQTCSMEFNVSKEFCHSVDVIQGGFITAMLDAAMAHAVFGLDDTIDNVSSLEIKTSYTEVSRAGKQLAEGRIIKAGYKTAFLEAKLYNTEGLLTALASSVCKLVRKPN